MLANQCSRFGVYDDLRDGRWSQGMQTPIGHTVYITDTRDRYSKPFIIINNTFSIGEEDKLFDIF